MLRSPLYRCAFLSPYFIYRLFSKLSLLSSAKRFVTPHFIAKNIVTFVESPAEFEANRAMVLNLSDLHLRRMPLIEVENYYKYLTAEETIDMQVSSVFLHLILKE